MVSSGSPAFALLDPQGAVHFQITTTNSPPAMSTVDYNDSDSPLGSASSSETLTDNGSQHDTEDQALLPKRPTPLPTKQLMIVALCLLAEPIA